MKKLLISLIVLMSYISYATATGCQPTDDCFMCTAEPPKLIELNDNQIQDLLGNCYSQCVQKSGGARKLCTKLCSTTTLPIPPAGPLREIDAGSVAYHSEDFNSCPANEPFKINSKHNKCPFELKQLNDKTWELHECGRSYLR